MPPRLARKVTARHPCWEIQRLDFDLFGKLRILTRMVASRRLRKRLNFAINVVFHDNIQRPGHPFTRGLGFLFGYGRRRDETLLRHGIRRRHRLSILLRCAAARRAQTRLSPFQRITPAIQRTNAKEAIRGAAAARGLGCQRFGFDGVACLRQSGSHHIPGQKSVVVVTLGHVLTTCISGRTRAFAMEQQSHMPDSVEICRWWEFVGVSISDNLRQNGVPGLADGVTRNTVSGGQRILRD